MLGNGRLISTWPARGGPVVADGTVYFAAGIWPFMGIFIHALDARTGEVVWTNDGDGSIYRKQPHQADSFGGVAPQGPLVVAGDRLLVPGGRSVPACLDRKTGKLLHYRLADNSKLGGGSDVQPGKDLFLNGGAAFDLATGDYLGPVGEPAVLAGDVLYAVQGSELRAFDLSQARCAPRQIDRKGKQGEESRPGGRATVAAVPVPRLEVLIRAGHRLYGAAEGQVLAYDLPLRASGAEAVVAGEDRRPARPPGRRRRPPVRQHARGAPLLLRREEGEPLTPDPSPPRGEAEPPPTNGRRRPRAS